MRHIFGLGLPGAVPHVAGGLAEAARPTVLIALSGDAEGGALGAEAGQSPNRPVSIARGMRGLRAPIQQEDHMHRSIVLMVMTRCAALAALTLALALAPSLSGGGRAEARAVKPKTCDQKYFECLGRCDQRAIEKYGGSVGVPGKAATEASNCAKRTCDPQWKKCRAAEKKPTKSEQPPTVGPSQPPVGPSQPPVGPGLKQQ